MNRGGPTREGYLGEDADEAGDGSETYRDEVKPKTVVLGFDALDFRYLTRFIDDLPNFTALLESGTSAPLESTHPPWTGSAWPSMYTGRDPSYHGVYDFFTYDGHPDTASLVTRKDVEAPAVWDYLSANGLQSVVLNVPVTHPADPVEGVLVPGYLAPEDTPGYPEEIREEISRAVGEEYTIYSRKETGQADDAKLTGYVDLIDLRGRAAEYLLASRDWEFAFLEVQKTDAVFHNFEDEAAFKQVYQAADRFVGRILDAVEDPVNVLVVSDHGIGPKRGYTIYLNEILREHGYVTTGGSDAGRSASITDVKASLTRADASAAESGRKGRSHVEQEANGRNVDRRPDVKYRAAEATKRVLDSIGIGPADVYAAAQKVGLESVLLSLISNRFKDELGEGIDWYNSTAYCRSNAELGVRINLEGRDPGGVVPESEYESVRRELVDLLESVETPDGNPAFERVFTADTIYDGPHAKRACDVLVIPNGMDHIVDTNLYGRSFVRVDSYDHDLEGVFIAKGPGIETGFEADSLSLTDVAPIVMALLDQPVPSDMTGHVPDGLLRESITVADYSDVPYGTAPDVATTDDQVTNRLEDLGYL